MATDKLSEIGYIYTINGKSVHHFYREGKLHKKRIYPHELEAKRTSIEQARKEAFNLKTEGRQATVKLIETTNSLRNVHRNWVLFQKDIRMRIDRGEFTLTQRAYHQVFNSTAYSTLIKRIVPVELHSILKGCRRVI